MSVSPWLESNIEPDTDRKPLLMQDKIVGTGNILVPDIVIGDIPHPLDGTHDFLQPDQGEVSEGCIAFNQMSPEERQQHLLENPDQTLALSQPTVVASYWKPKQTRQAKIKWWGWLIFIFYCISLWVAYIKNKHSM